MTHVVLREMLDARNPLVRFDERKVASEMTRRGSLLNKFGKSILAVSFGLMAMLGHGKTLVVYFSWSGNTRFAAETVATAIGADLAEIVPVNQYPSEVQECSARVVPEIRDKTTPAIRPLGKDLDAYDQMFVGTPIWMGSIASPVRTFLTQSRLSGKKLRLFVTHGRSGPRDALRDFSDLVEMKGATVTGFGKFPGKTIRENISALKSFALTQDGEDKGAGRGMAIEKGVVGTTPHGGAKGSN